MGSMNLDLLKKLCDVSGLPGQEEKVTQIIREDVSEYADKVYTDHLGNLYMEKGLGKSGPHLMFAAHTDEVGLMVEKIDEDGCIKFLPLGGVDSRVLLAKRVRVGENEITGVIGVKPHHLSTFEEQSKVIPIHELRIDIGSASKIQTEKFVQVGDPICFDTDFELQDGCVKAKALDDRVGCFIMTELIKGTFDIPVTFVWTVQEEVGLRGASLATARIQPDILIVLEGTGAADVPVNGDLARNPSLGAGPVITVLDGSVVCNEDLLNLFTEVANSNNIPWQYKRPLVGGTDAGAAVRVKSLRTAVVAVPSRYIHSPVALTTLSDINTTLELVRATSRKLGEVFS